MLLPVQSNLHRYRLQQESPNGEKSGQKNKNTLAGCMVLLAVAICVFLAGYKTATVRLANKLGPTQVLIYNGVEYVYFVGKGVAKK